MSTQCSIKELKSKFRSPVFCTGVKEVDFPLGGGGKEPRTGIRVALMSLLKDLLISPPEPEALTKRTAQKESRFGLEM